MLERRKLFYTEQEINELANAVEYTGGTSNNVDYIFIPLGKSNYLVLFLFCNEYGLVPAVSSSSSKYAKLISLIDPLLNERNYSYVVGPRWEISSKYTFVRVKFNGSTSGSGLSNKLYGSTSDYGNYTGEFMILPYLFATNLGSFNFCFGFFDYLYNEDEPLYIKILIGGHIGVNFNDYNYYYNKIVSASSIYPTYYIPIS